MAIQKDCLFGTYITIEFLTILINEGLLAGYFDILFFELEAQESP